MVRWATDAETNRGPRRSPSATGSNRQRQVAEHRYTVGEAAALLGRSTQTIRNWIRDERVHGERFGPSQGQFLIEGSEIERVRALIGRDGH